MYASSQPLFSQARGVGIIFEHHRCAQPALDLLFDGVIAPVWKILSLTYHSSMQVDNPGHSDSDPGQSIGGAEFVDQTANTIAHLIDDMITPADHFSLTGDFLHQRAICRYRCNAEVRSSQIYANCK